MTTPTPSPDITEYALALIDLGHGRWSEALERLGAIDDPALRVVVLPDRVEAAMRAGRDDEARAALLCFERWAAGAEAGWAAARLAACRGLVDGRDADYEEALALAAAARAFDRARVRLLYGEHLRRSRRRTDARAQLGAALAGFRECRADPWCERAQAELTASGQTARARDPHAPAELTPQEAQIAAFVAQGLTNKAVATRLYLSPRTIDAHLRSVFAKLGISSRTQLVRHQLAAA